jgi:hypothetical protein
VVFAIFTVTPAHIFAPVIAPPTFAVENTSISTVAVTTGPQPNVAVRRYLYIPEVAITSLKVASVPGNAVQTVKGVGDLSQLYVGPAEAGAPVEAAVVLVMLTVPPGQISLPVIAPPTLAIEYTERVMVRAPELQFGAVAYCRVTLIV